MKMGDLQLQYIENINVVECKIIGSFPTTDAEIDFIFESVYIFCKKHNSTKIILDYRYLEYNQTVLQMVRATERTDKNNLNSEKFKVAFVFDKSSQAYNNYRLVLAEADTKKFMGIIKTKYRVFDKYEEAISWLG